MKIANEHVARLLEARLERIQRTQQGQRHPCFDGPEPDRATFSARAAEVRAALLAARAADEADDPRLAHLSQEVKAGRYRVPAEAVADALLRDLGR
jgi:hypothetical protein